MTEIGTTNEARQCAKDRSMTDKANAFPTTLSELTFRSSFDPAANANIYKTLSALRKSTLSIPNRLLSILQDAEFVESLYIYLCQHCPPHISSTQASRISGGGSAQVTHSSNDNHASTWPLVPNERSGSWPLPPHFKAESQQAYPSSFDHQPRSQSHLVSAYFKSTDGHVNQWSFSPRRLNLPVLEILGRAGRAILIDTTRRGKAYPDALRRTVPIFTSVWNRALFPELSGNDVNDFQGFGLETREISQIESRLPAFVQDLKALGLPMDEIRKKLRRPIRCLWISQPISRGDWNTIFEDLTLQVKAERKKWDGTGGVNLLICCSASRKVVGAEMSDEGYIQGAGDDSEGWSHGLTAKIFWDHEQELIRSVKAGEDVQELVKNIVLHEKESRPTSPITLVQPTTNLHLSTGVGDSESFDLIIDCNAEHDDDDPRFLGLGCKEAKTGSKMLREQLPKAMNVLQGALRKSPETRVLIICSTGKDLSVGVALAMLCSFYDDTGTVHFDSGRQVDKQLIRQRLAWITSSKPDANPSRATLQAVNSVLMDRPR